MATSMLLGPLIALVNRQVSNYLLQQYQELDGMEEQLTILERKLPAILDVIIDAEEQGTHRPGVSAWLKALKAVAYKANDIFDEFKYEALRREAKRRGNHGNLSTSIVLANNPLVFRYRMSKKLRKIVSSIEDLVADMNAFGFRYRPQMPTSKQWRQTDSIIIDSENIVSREKEKQHIVNLLLTDASNRNLMVLPIIGMGGLGKTTFAQIIYNDPEIQKHFQLRKWVCVLDDFDVTSIANKISMSIEKECENALEKLQQEVRGKRYLLILDDVWNCDADKWAKLKYCLQQYGGVGSAILMTTRDQGVAQLMGTTKAHQLVRMEKEDLLAIFEKRAFRFDEQKPDELVQIGWEIMDRCHGSPLAAKALGSMLSTRKAVEEWRAVLTKSSICDDENGILPILKLSYDDLPSYMKQCFAFCAIFPKNYVIDVEMLILLWMANDFIPSEEAIRPETKGKQIFNELASRSFFQDVKEVPLHKDESGHSYRTICSIHDLMHDVAVSVIGKECFTIAEGHNYIEFLPNTVRHLFLCSDRPETLSDVSLKQRCQGMQTLLCIMNTSNSSLHYLSKCHSLRALRLYYHNLGGLQIRVKHLKHLRFLDLSGNCHIKSLPEEICILYNLQTLNLSGCISLGHLPKDIKNMIGLRHLYTDGCMSLKSMPPNLGHLTSLQTLTYFVVGNNSGCSSIGELRHLKLQGQLQLCHLQNVTEADVSMSSHGEGKDLTQLSFGWKDDHNEVIDLHEKVLDAFTPNSRLKILSVDSYRSSNFPTWVTNPTMMQDLIKLQLVSCTMCESLPQLWQLPSLEILHLEGLQSLQYLCSGVDNSTSSTFPKLRELILVDLKSLNGWWEVKGGPGQKLVFPLLEILSIDSCSNLENFPDAVIFGESSQFLDNKGNSPFPALKNLKLHNLKSLKAWGTQERYQPIFPQLENANIMECPELATLPEAPKLRVLVFPEDKSLMWLSIARYMATLSDVRLTIAASSSQVQCAIQQVSGTEEFSHKTSNATMELRGCYFFCMDLECFVNLQDLVINCCNELVYWPLKQLQCLVSLKRLTVYSCNNLTKSGDVLEAPLEKNQLLPCLEYIEIKDCPKLVEVLILPSSLREIYIERCGKLEFIWGQKDTENKSWYAENKDDLRSESYSILVSSADTPLATNTHLPCMESLTVISCQSLVVLLNFPLYLKEIHIWSCPELRSIRGKQDIKVESKYVERNNGMAISESSSDLSASITIEDQGTWRSKYLLPCLEYLRIAYCVSLVEVLALPSSMRTIIISECPKLEVLSGKLDKLGQLDIRFCEKLKLVESYEGSFLSLETVSIVGCENMASLPNKHSNTPCTKGSA